MPLRPVLIRPLVKVFPGVSVFGWSPNQIPDLVDWWESDQGLTPGTPGVGISDWADQKGIVDLSQASSPNRPIYNGQRQGIEIDGVDDYLESSVALSALAHLHSSAHVYVRCVRKDSNTTAVLLRTCLLSQSQTGIFFRSPSIAAEIQLVVANGSGTNYSANIQSTGSDFAPGTHTVGYWLDSTGTEIVVDGSVVASQVPLVAAVSTGAASQQLSLAQSANDFGGTVKEILVYGRKLISSEDSKVQQYLSEKWP